MRSKTNLKIFISFYIISFLLKVLNFHKKRQNKFFLLITAFLVFIFFHCFGSFHNDYCCHWLFTFYSSHVINFIIFRKKQMCLKKNAKGKKAFSIYFVFGEQLIFFGKLHLFGKLRTFIKFVISPKLINIFKFGKDLLKSPEIYYQKHLSFKKF